jgi:hypothetical protein
VWCEAGQDEETTELPRREREGKGGEPTDRGLGGGVGRDELAEVLRVVARPAAQRASHRRGREVCAVSDDSGQAHLADSW